MTGSKWDVWAELRFFKRKYYINQIIKGALLLGGVVLTAFLLANTLEFSFRFGQELRLFLFVFLLASFTVSFYLFLLDPLLKLLGYRNGMSDEEAARRIGNSFPRVSDRLLNLIQLKRLSESNALASAGVDQKTGQVAEIEYRSSIKYRDNSKYLKYILSPVSLLAILLIAYPAFITEPTERIVNFNEDFVSEVPFSFNAEYEEYAFRNEDYRVGVSLKGSAFPENLYIITKGRKIKMLSTGNGEYEHTFKNLQDNRSFRFEGAGYFSREYSIRLVDRPNLRNFNVELDYPAYTGITNERLSNIGNLEIPEGTNVTWQFSTLLADSLSAHFLGTNEWLTGTKEGNDLFELSNKIFVSDNYTIRLRNRYSNNKELLKYYIRVIRDQYPEIELNTYQDTVLYSLVVLGGNISDDYGLTRLELKYTISDRSGKEQPLKIIQIPISRRQNNQGYYYQWSIDSLDIQPGQSLSYYLEVWDNDGINGRKSSRTGLYQFSVPSRKELKSELDDSENQTQSDIEQTLKDTRELQEKLKEAEERLKGTRNLNWEDEKLLKEILDKKEELDKALKELQEQNQKNQLQRDRFSPQSESLQEKSRQLQESMEQMMDEETKRLFEELQKLLEDKSGVEQMQQLMEQMNRRSRDFEKEMERTLELFKQLKLENKINEAVNELNELSLEQLKLSEETEKEGSDPNELLDKQNELIDRFNDLDEDLKNIGELNQELESPEPLPDQQQLKKMLAEQQQESKKNLEALKKAIEDAQERLSNKEDAEGKDAESDNKVSEEGENQKGDEGKDGEEKSGEDKESGDKSNDASKSEEKQGEKSGDKNSDKKNEESGGKKDDSDEQGQSESEQQNESQEKDSTEQSNKNEGESREEAKKAQIRAGRIIKQMAEQMEQMQSGMEMQRMEEDLENLRNIVHNLLKLSFDQEELMASFRDVNESDPGFVPLSQEQLKLRDDAKVIQDSLYSLAKRRFDLRPIITKKVSSMNEHMENAMNSLKERRKYRAVSEQQFAMTEMNDLALLLDEMLNQIMMNISSAKGTKKSKNQPQHESLGEMQQKLNEQVRQLKESGKTGRELSEELAKLAAEQARIRKALEEMQQRLEQMDMENQSAPGSEIPSKMEDSELDLVNKRLTEQLIRRQKDILTRLLNAENAMRERELDEERKGETARDYEKIIPRSFDEYLKQKEQEIEMLKTLPPRLFPHYKKEVSDYFKRIGERRP